MAEPVVPLGEIVTTHGLRGWLKLNPFNTSTTILTGGLEVILEKSGERWFFHLEESNPQRNQFLINSETVCEG